MLLREVGDSDLTQVAVKMASRGCYANQVGPDLIYVGSDLFQEVSDLI